MAEVRYLSDNGELYDTEELALKADKAFKLKQLKVARAQKKKDKLYHMPRLEATSPKHLVELVQSWIDQGGNLEWKKAITKITYMEHSFREVRPTTDHAPLGMAYETARDSRPEDKLPALNVKIKVTYKGGISFFSSDFMSRSHPIGIKKTGSFREDPERENNLAVYIGEIQAFLSDLPRMKSYTDSFARVIALRMLENEHRNKNSLETSRLKEQSRTTKPYLDIHNKINKYQAHIQQLSDIRNQIEQRYITQHFIPVTLTHSEQQERVDLENFLRLSELK